MDKKQFELLLAQANEEDQDLPELYRDISRMISALDPKTLPTCFSVLPPLEDTEPKTPTIH